MTAAESIPPLTRIAGRPVEAPIDRLEQTRPELVLGLRPGSPEGAEERVWTPVALLGHDQTPCRVQQEWPGSSLRMSSKPV